MGDAVREEEGEEVRGKAAEEGGEKGKTVEEGGETGRVEGVGRQ